MANTPRVSDTGVWGVSDTGVWVVGGEQRSARSMRELGDSWYGYARGVVLSVNDHLDRAFIYESPPGVCAPDDPILFKSATIVGNKMFACTQTEVLVLSLPDFAVCAHLSLPFFNDVHHVLPGRDSSSVLVAVSGLELVVEVRLADGKVIDAWDVLGGDPWPRIGDGVDYRHGVDLKPHRAHPNYLFRLGDEVFVTRFELRDAISLADPSRHILIGRERVHDGVVHDGRIWFTTVDGAVAEVDAANLEVRAMHELHGSSPDDAVLGWCRGLHFVGDGTAWVGFSRIRVTRFRQTVSWVRAGLSRSLPTRIARYRTDDWTCIDEIDLEPAGMNAVFSIATIAKGAS